MDKQIDPHLTEVDLTVLQDLLAGPDCDEQAVVEKLSKLKQEPTVFCTWDAKDLPSKDNLLGQALQTYTKWAQSVVRSPNDVVFLTHILLYFTTSLPSALLLYRHFSWTHGVLHFLMQCYYSGSFTLMLHNCIHQNGLLSRPRYALADRLWPYILEPLFGHTWDSYFYHHVKHHHVEGNGPDDLSSTLRYQRDELSHFAMYVGRFLFFIWLELPLYFLRKRKTALAAKAALSEFASYAFLYAIWSYEWRPTLFVLVLPFCLLRLGLMVGNFGQHALVDDVEPDSDFRSSITLIDVPSNRYCFNDGYHTSHHLNPLRHWRDHPAAFMKAKRDYENNAALVFRNIDYLMMTYRILRKDYLYLADCMVPIGPEQLKLSRDEKAELLRSKTRRFSEEEIREKFGRKNTG